MVPRVHQTRPGDDPLVRGSRRGSTGAMPRLSRAAADAVARVRDVAGDSSTAAHLADRALGALRGAVPFDEGTVFLVDPDSLLLTHVVGYHGPAVEGVYGWVRDVYLVAGEAGAMHFPTLLGSAGGVGAYHADLDRWLRVAPVGIDGSLLARRWHETETPPGGFLRYGIASRRRWIGALQLARHEPGPGFRPSEIEVLDRAVPVLARALDVLLASGDRATDPETPPAGRVLFDAERRLTAASTTGLRWLDRLSAADHLHQPPDVPVGLQALVSHLAATGAASARIGTWGAAVSGEVLVELSPATGAPSVGYCLTIEPATATTASVTAAQWSVAKLVARGLSDKEVAAALGVAVSTVHERVAALHAALQTHTRGQLVAALANIPHARP